MLIENEKSYGTGSASVAYITRIRENEQLRSTFMSIISHELQTPIAIIKGYASTLRREDAKWDEQTIRGQFVRDVLSSDELDQDKRRRVLVTGLRALDGRGDDLEVH